MTPTEFFYWLQGYFEISGGLVGKLTTDQVKCIERHIKLVEAMSEANEHHSAIEIPARLIAIRSLLEVLSSDPVSMTAAIRLTINAQFEHVIDPKAGDEEQQAKLNEIHGRPPGWSLGDPLCRC